MLVKLVDEDIIISEFLRSVGPWSDYIVIGGGYALIIYKLYLSGKTLTPPPVATRDIDSLVPRRVTSNIKTNIAEHLTNAGFSHVFKDRHDPATEAYIKEINNQEIEIEFLTDTSTREDKTKNVPIAGIVAQPLSYLTLSLQMTMEFTTNSKQKGLVVAPGAWIFHKGLTFVKRKEKSKKLKDLYGIWYLASNLGRFSEQSIKEFYFLVNRYPTWYKTLKKNIEGWLEDITPEYWSLLESQDPYGKLNRLNFLNTIGSLTNGNT